MYFFATTLYLFYIITFFFFYIVYFLYSTFCSFHKCFQISYCNNTFQNKIWWLISNNLFFLPLYLEPQRKIRVYFTAELNALQSEYSLWHLKKSDCSTTTRIKKLGLKFLNMLKLIYYFESVLFFKANKIR